MEQQQNYTLGQIEELARAQTIVACFSLVGELFVITLWLKFKDLRSFVFDLVLMIALSDLLETIGNILGDPGLGRTHGTCVAQEFFISFGGLSSLFWVIAVAFTLNMSFIKDDQNFQAANIKGLGKHYALVCWGVPLVMAILPWSSDSYDREYVDTVCWLRHDGGHLAWPLLQFYIPLWVGVSFSCYTFVLVWQKLRVMHQQAGGESTSANLSGRLMYYPVILVICWLPDTVETFITVAKAERNYGFSVLAVVLSGLMGLVNATVYGMTPIIRDRISAFCSGRASEYDEFAEPSKVDPN